MAFLGLPWRRKRLSDVELVEKARRDVARLQRIGKWLTAFNVVVGLALLGMAGMMAELTYKIIVDLAPGNALVVPGQVMVSGMVMAFVFGVFFAGMIGQFAERLKASMLLLGDQRKNQLLVQYHDRLQALGELDETPPEPPATVSPAPRLCDSA